VLWACVRLYILGTTVALLTFVVLVVRFCIEKFVQQGLTWSSVHLQSILDYVTISITLLVVAVPEGLPLAVVLALAYSIKVRLHTASEQ